MSTHGHDQAPTDPRDGEVFNCRCGVAFEYVVLDDGYSEWVSIDPIPPTTTPHATRATLLVEPPADPYAPTLEELNAGIDLS